MSYDLTEAAGRVLVALAIFEKHRITAGELHSRVKKILEEGYEQGYMDAQEAVCEWNKPNH